MPTTTKPPRLMPVRATRPARAGDLAELERAVQVVCSGPGAERYLFCALADARFESDEAAAEWVAGGGR